MKTIVELDYSYGYLSITFVKEFQFNFAPFYDLVIFEKNEEYEFINELVNTKYTKTIISINVIENCFEVDIMEFWREPVTGETIDDIFEKAKAFNWKRTDSTDVNMLKDLMKKDYESKPK